MRRWFRDTLFLRLFLLMWVALVVSHLAAFEIVTGTLFASSRSAQPAARGGSLPPFPALPPTPDMGRERGRAEGLGRFEGAAPGGPDGFGAPGPGRHGPPMLSPALLVLDYAVRVIAIGIAAAFAARWLTAPVRRLVTASATLGRSLRERAPLPLLDERGGTVEIREAARVFNQMARELDAQFKSRGLLMAALSHDLKTPLTRMRMRLENESEQVFVQRCIADIAEMGELLDIALDVFRGTGNDEPMQTLDVTSLLQSIVDDRIDAGEPVSFAGAPALAKARPSALRRVIGNLLGNALRYGGRAEVAVDVVGDRVRVRIDDDGPGIPAPLLDAVFEPFFRVDSSRNKTTGGSGLGLHIARDLLRAMDGDIVLANRQAGGLRAEFRLPRAV